MIGTFAGLAIFIACLGLLGLASFLVRQRTKEIGIRKVLGASVGGIVLLLNREFLLLLAWAGLVAMPLSYALLRHWLEDYPYQVPFRLWPYVTALLGCVLLTWFSVSWQSWRAAKANPVDSLHDE
jgi:putative ABC transport system permease protein